MRAASGLLPGCEGPLSREADPIRPAPVTNVPLDLDPDFVEAIDKAASDEGLSRLDWLRSVLGNHLRRGGYLPALADEGLRPDQLNSQNDG